MIFVDWPANQKICELNMLQEFLDGTRIEKVLEIGTFYGGTALLWAKMVEPYNGKVYCVEAQFDWVIVPPYTNRVDFIKHANGNSRDLQLKKFDVLRYNQVYKGTQWEKYIVELEGSSHDPEFKSEVKNTVGKVDILFIDGDHSYEGVKDDFYSYAPLVKSNGYIILHDILDTSHHRACGCFVHELWNELKTKYSTMEFLDPAEHTRMGIGLIKNFEEVKK